MRRGHFISLVLGILFGATTAFAQNAALVGNVRDVQQAVIPGAAVTLTNSDTGASLIGNSNEMGAFEFATVRPGNYTLKVEQPGFRAFTQSLVLAVGQRGRVDVVLQVGEISAAVTVEVATSPLVQTESSALGDVVDTKKISDVPLNGRFFLDLALLTAGTVVPSTNNRTFLATPSGIGISGINASGTREDSTNYMFDGINLSDMLQNQITFQPNVESIQEFKVQTNAFSAEYGRNAGIIVNAISKQGSNSVHGSAWEFLRNEKLDAKNFFDRADQPIPPFKRNVFGYSIGGPVIRNNTFFFHSYEGRQGREVTTLNTQVPTAAERASVTNPVILKLLDLVPQPNSGNRFQGTAPRKRGLNQFTGRVDHSFSARDLVFGNFISNRDSRTEPTLQLNNLPGFGDFRPAERYFVSLGYTHIFSPTMTNEVRAGANRVHIQFVPDAAAKYNPQDFGMTTGSSIFPNINVTGVMRFGGIDGFPQGRGDTALQYNDTVSWIHGRHSLKFGAELRRFRNNNFNTGTGGLITFPSLAAFLAATPISSATQTRLPVTNSIRATALDTFVQDDFRMTSRWTWNLGLRWEYNGVPNEVHNRLAIFDFTQNKLVSVGNGIERPYERQFTNFGPRIGFSYDPFGKGKTAIRAGVGVYYDQPVTNLVSALSQNPPFSSAVNFTSNINIAAPFSQPGGGPSAIAAQAISPDFQSARLVSYNLNVQQELSGTTIQIAYVGSQGRHLRINGDYNQGINFARPIAGFSSINVNMSASNSNYNGMWLSVNRRLAHGVTFSSSYTFSKSIDNNSVGSSNPQVQDFRNLRAERARSDFDATHRFVLSGVYILPFKSEGAFKRAVEGWSLAPIVNLQSGNPFSPIIPNLPNGSGSLLNFDRPDIVPGQSIKLDNPTPNLFFNKAAFLNPDGTPYRQPGSFGNAGRNIIEGPGLSDVDLSLTKNTLIRENVNVQFRAEAFNVFNHPNFAQPNQTVNSADFGKITTTRTARGDLGSSRQIQFGLKFMF
ncbi:MAG TPA: carboxypeptidase regulatory-like domain-containing protein [Terriglobia bacterium]|nr:carboxypeptidase regulatory-like domain-containing protein [Terriglobia bacterium]